MSKFDQNRNRLAWLGKAKGLVLWSQFFMDKIGLFSVWSYFANLVLKKKGDTEAFRTQHDLSAIL